MPHNFNQRFLCCVLTELIFHRLLKVKCLASIIWFIIHLNYRRKILSKFLQKTWLKKIGDK